MSDRLIIDNVLVAFEIMHHIKQKRNGRVGEMAIKLDMSKAFVQDGLSWYLGKDGDKMCYHSYLFHKN